MKNTGTLKVSLPSAREVLLTRVFQAPRHLVFDALTKPELLKRWFGPRGWTLPECQVDLRVGGSWRFKLQGPDGMTMVMFGEYREIAPPERLVHTEAFEEFSCDAQGVTPSVVTTVLTEANGVTTMNATILYASQEIRDQVLASGMEHGAAECYDRLNELFL